MKSFLLRRSFAPIYVFASFFCAQGLFADQSKFISEQNIESRNIDSNKFDGMYFGLNGGLDFTKANTDVSGSGGISINNSSNTAMHGKSFGILAGYGQTIRGIYIGGEIGGDLNFSQGKTNSSDTTNQVTINNHIKKNNSLYLAGRIGNQISGETLLYLKGGIASNSYNIKSDVNFVGRLVSVSSSTTKRVTQPIIGTGVEFYGGILTRKASWRVGAEYEHTFKRNITNLVSSENFNGNTKISASSNTIKLRFIVSL